MNLEACWAGIFLRDNNCHVLGSERLKGFSELSLPRSCPQHCQAAGHDTEVIVKIFRPCRGIPLPLHTQRAAAPQGSGQASLGLMQGQSSARFSEF